MNLKRVLVIVAALAVVAVAVLAWLGYFNSLFGPKYAAPPCAQLPGKARVTEAIAQRGNLVDRLTGAGGEVVAGSPCEDKDKSLVTVRVSTDEAETAVGEVLGNSEGFGVPATIERR